MKQKPGTGQLSTPCRHMEDLTTCLKAPSHAVPTVEFTVYNFELPLNNNDINWLEQSEINIFAQQNQTQTNTSAPSRSSSRNLTDMTLTFDVPFVLLGICVYAYCDPVGFTVPGNFFGPRADVVRAPASPDNMWYDTAFINTLTSGDPNVAVGSITRDTVFPGTLDWGGPAMRMIWALMHAYRLVMRCPTSSYEILMDEALADVGNCCGQVDWQGFGNSSIDQNYYVQRVNDRIASTGFFPVAATTDGPAWNDPGVFFPINSHGWYESAGQRQAFSTTPLRLMPQGAAYGRPFAMPTVEQWYRLPCPIPFPSVPQPKLKISLVQEDGDQMYRTRMIREATGYHAQVATALNNNHFPVTDGPNNASQGYSDSQKFPGGMVRIGLGLKGFEVRESCLAQLNEMMSTQEGMMRAIKEFGPQGGLVAGPAPEGRISMPVGMIGR